MNECLFILLDRICLHNSTAFQSIFYYYTTAPIYCQYFFGYSKNFTRWSKYTILHLTKDSKLDNVNKKLLNDVIKYREVLNDDLWGSFRTDIGPRRFEKVMAAVSRINMNITDTKVSIDLKRILRLPSTLHSKVSMKSTLIKNIETFDPFDDAVPNFVFERK